MPSKIDNRHKIIGHKHRALSRYFMILNRLKNTDRSKNKGYAGIEMRVSKEDFVAWFMQNDFDGASVDRVDNSKHYELSNMRLIPLAENIAKDKLIAKDGFCRCYRCEQVKPIDEFVIESRRMSTGRSTVCRPCERRRNNISRAANKLVEAA